MRTLLRSLKLWQKFMALAVICTLMAGLPFYITFRAETQAIEGARSEAAGIAPVKATLQLMQGVTAHRGPSRKVLEGNTGAQGARKAAAEKVEQNFASVASSLNATGFAHALAEHEQARSQWQQL